MQETKEKLQHILKEIKSAKDFLKFPELEERLKQRDLEMSAEGFWDDQEHAQKISEEAGHLRKTLEEWNDFEKEVTENAELAGMIKAEETPDEAEDIKNSTLTLEKKLDKLSIQLYLNGKYDKLPAIISIHAGTGGTDAQDWAEMLLRMYTRYVEKKEWKIEVLEKTDADDAGIKSAELRISGQFAYGFLKEEHGVHRLVRLSPFNSGNTRETSFVLVEITPEIEEHEAEIKEDDLKIETFRASGHGGQSVNTTDSAVRITHVPTGLTVQCQNERSQLQNKTQALKNLKSKLVSLQEKHHLETIGDLKGEHTQHSWGNQIRSYVLHPYQMVKDHRTDHETNQIEKVLDGDLDDLIEASLRSHQKK